MAGFSGFAESLCRLIDMGTEYIKKMLERKKAEEERLQHDQDYKAAYIFMAEVVVSTLNWIQGKYSCLQYYDIAVVSSAYQYHDANTMAFYIPWSHPLTNAEKNQIMPHFVNAFQHAIGQIYPQYDKIDVFKNRIFRVVVTSYGIQLKSLRHPFYRL